MKKIINFIIVAMKFITSIMISVLLIGYLIYLTINKKVKERKASKEKMDRDEINKTMVDIDGRINFTKEQILIFVKFNYTKENINNLIEKI